MPIRLIAVGESRPVAGADLVLPDADGRCRRLWGAATPGSACLLRPDQHLCARWLALDGPRLRAALEVALPR
jgi:3-(3-hydroxy-phenyl)propionate hydroxylase